MRLLPALLLLIALTTLNCGGAPCGPGTCGDAGAAGGGIGFGGSSGTGGNTGSGGGSAQDAGEIDAGAQDAGAEGAGAQDAGAQDAGAQDAGAQDAGAQDAGVDGGAADAGACGPCVAPPNGTSACDGRRCSVTCDTGYVRCFRQGVAVCAPTTANDSCGPSCEICSDTVGGTSACDGTRCVTTCRPGYHRCGYEQCVPDDSIVACGSSCMMCPAPPPGSKQVATCDQGVCGTRCVATCNGTCVDPRLDEQNCGGCGIVCGAGTSCIDGQCTGVCRYELDLPSGTPVADLPSLQLGDVDGDGKADGVFRRAVALSRFDGGTVSFVVRNESTLELPLAVADFTRDGRADVVAMSGFGRFLSIATDAGFAAPTVLSTVLGPVATGDFDEVNGPDLVMGEASQLVVRLNTGNGTFTNGITEYFGGSLRTVLAGDVNGDRHRDLVVITDGSPLRVATLLGNGRGQFVRGGVINNAPTTVARLNDSDADGRDELVFDRNSVTNRYLYSAAGAWEEFGWFPYDMVTGRSTDGGIFECHPGDHLTCRDGQTSTFGNWLTFSGTRSVRLADVTGDGLEDLVAVSFDGGIAAAARRGDILSFGPTSVLVQPGYSIDSVVDLNADGYLDQILRGSQLGFALSGPGGVVGPFQPLLDAGVLVNDVELVDLDGDAFGDVIVTPRGEPRALLFRGGPGGLSPAGQFPLYDPRFQDPFPSARVRAEDMDGDGARDVVVEAPGWNYWARALGSGVYGPLHLGLGAGALIFGDVNGDGRTDFVRHYSGSLSVSLNAGGGVFYNLAASYPFPTSARLRPLRDLNGDGKLDLDLDTVVRFGDGNGGFSGAIAVAPGLHLDVDRDGRFDTFDAEGLVTLTGSGRSEATAYLLNGAGWNGVKDLDGDGVPDAWWCDGAQLTQVRAVCR